MQSVFVYVLEHEGSYALPSGAQIIRTHMMLFAYAVQGVGVEKEETNVFIRELRSSLLIRICGAVCAFYC